jgi:hypothetical protein
VLGTLQDVIEIFAINGDHGLARGVSSVIGQEGEQDGFYRRVLGKKPSALPFLTTSALDFAFTAIQGFTVPGTCPNLHTIPLQTFQPLTLLTPPTASTSKLRFEVSVAVGSDAPKWVTYINQQNVPVVENATVVSTSGSMVTVEALFPYSEFEMNGLTIAAVTNSSGPFASADAVAQATVFGPALIEVN